MGFINNLQLILMHLEETYLLTDSADAIRAVAGPLQNPLQSDSQFSPRNSLGVVCAEELDDF